VTVCGKYKDVSRELILKTTTILVNSFKEIINVQKSSVELKGSGGVIRPPFAIGSYDNRLLNLFVQVKPHDV